MRCCPEIILMFHVQSRQFIKTSKLQTTLLIKGGVVLEAGDLKYTIERI